MEFSKAKSVACSIAAAVSMLGFTSSASAASAPQPAVSAPEATAGRDMLTEQYSQLGLSEDQLATVIQAWEADGRLDAMDPDASPVRSEERTLATTGSLGVAGSPTHVDWFADGSIRTQTIEKPRAVVPGEGSTMEVHGCTMSSSSGVRTFTNCSVVNMWGTVQIGYLASFEIVSGQSDRMSWASNGWQRCAGVTCAAPAVSIFRAKEFNGVPAVVRGTSDVSAAWGSWQVWTELQVGNDSYWQASS